MSGPPLTPAEATRVLWQIGLDIDEQTEAVIETRREHLALVRAHRKAYATSVLTSTGTVEDRRRKAEQETDEAWFAMETKGQEIEACKDRLKALRDRSEIGRSINSNLKEELRNLGGQP